MHSVARHLTEQDQDMLSAFLSLWFQEASRQKRSKLKQKIIAHDKALLSRLRRTIGLAKEVECFDAWRWTTQEAKIHLSERDQHMRKTMREIASSDRARLA